jgi:hypothetical protein
LKNGIGNALIDTGSQVSLIVADGLVRGLKINKHVLKIRGVTGNFIETKGYVDLCIGETSPHKFLVIETLPLNCDMLLGQDWLERFGCQFQIPTIGVDIILPAYSETSVRIPTTEKGCRLVEAKELQENVFCASSIVECTNSSFVCLITNCNSTDETLRKFPQTQEFSKLSGRFYDVRAGDSRKQVLQAQLRLALVKVGEEEIRQICAEYKDFFKLPGDKVNSYVSHYALCTNSCCSCK